MAKQKYYAVRKGRKTGIFRSWAECKKQTDGFKGSLHKSFNNKEDAEKFLGGSSTNKNTNQDKAHGSSSIEIYVDGSYNHDFKVLGYACVIVKDSKVFHTIEESVKANEIENTRNIGAEVRAALAGVEWAIENKYKKVYLYYDYLGIKNWVDGSWEANTEDSMNYVDDIKEYQKAIDIEFVKVKAHSGDFYNEMVDDLAKKAVEDKIRELK